MKKKLLQLSAAVLSLVFLAAVAHAYTPPISAPTAGNSDAPLNVGSVDQAKSGGISVGTFLAQKSAYFDQNVLFDGLIRGGTPAASAPITFGGPSNKVDVLFSGALSINGVYQSNSLKTNDGGTDPICADANGVIYVCSQTPPPPPTPAQPIDVAAQYATYPAGTFVVGTLSQSTEVSVTITVDASVPSSGNGTLSYIKNFYTADARAAGSCSLTSTPTTLGTLTIYAGETRSDEVANGGGTLQLPSGCNPATTTITISSYTPHSTPQGRPIVALQGIPLEYQQ